MGYKTHKTLPYALPKRTNYVLTSHKHLRNNFINLSNTKQLFNRAKGGFVVIGGQEVYELLLPQIEYLYITKIAGNFNCTKFFPYYEDKYNRVFKSKRYHQNGYQFWYEHWRAN